MAQYVIFDTEFTAWPGSWQTSWKRPGEYREIIQIGAIKFELKPSHPEIISSLNVLVKPNRNPQLSEYIQTLTGIHQRVCDEHGIDFPSAAAQFFEFVEAGNVCCLSWGKDAAILKENYHLNDLTWPYSSNDFIDFRDTVQRAGLTDYRIASGELAKHIGVELPGHGHNALYDVKSIFAYLKYQLSVGKLTLRTFKEST